MSVTINLNERKVNFPSNFFENETLSTGELNLERKETFWNTNSLYTLPKILLKAKILLKDRTNSTNEQSHINVVEMVRKGLQPQNFVYKLTKNFDQDSQIPFLNLLLFEGNNTNVCYFYYSRNFIHPDINIIGEPEKIYVLYFYQNQTNSAYYDILSIDDGSLSYESRVNYPECPKCPSPNCPDCPYCPDMKPYTYSLYACIAIIFILLTILIYNIMKVNKETKIEK